MTNPTNTEHSTASQSSNHHKNKASFLVHINTFDTHTQYNTRSLIIPVINGIEIILPHHINSHYTVMAGLAYLLPVGAAEPIIYKISYSECIVSNNIITLNTVYCIDIQKLNTSLHDLIKKANNPYARLHTRALEESPLDIFSRYQP